MQTLFDTGEIPEVSVSAHINDTFTDSLYRNYSIIPLPEITYIDIDVSPDTLIFNDLPIAIDNKGKKISKADKITKLVASNPRRSLVNALKFLGQSPPTGIIDSDTKTILDWAIDNWSIELLPNKSKIHYSVYLN